MINDKEKKGSINLSQPFIYFLVVLAIFAVLYLLQDFLTQIVIAAMLATFSYPLYHRLANFLSKKDSLSALIMTLVLLALIVIPLTQLLIYSARELPSWFQSGQLVLDRLTIIEDQAFSFLRVSLDSQANIRAGLTNVLASFEVIALNATSDFLKNLGSLFLAIFIFHLSYFYFLLQGSYIKARFLRFSPLARNYNLELIDSFKNISQNSFLSIGVSAVIQGFLSAFSLMFIGWPFILAFTLSLFLSIVPYFLGIFYLFIAAYLFSLGQIWTAALILTWNLLLVVNLDKFIRAYIAKGKTKVNMIFMLFAIMGGIALFGITGVFIGPLITALALKIIDIYGHVFGHKLEG